MGSKRQAMPRRRWKTSDAEVEERARADRAEEEARRIIRIIQAAILAAGSGRIAMRTMFESPEGEAAARRLAKEIEAIGNGGWNCRGILGLKSR